MSRATGITATLATLLLAALGIAHSASDSKRVTPVPKPTAGAGGGEKWAVIVGVTEYDDPAIPDLGYGANDARAIYEILTNPGRGGYSPGNVRLLAANASDPENRPTRKNIMGRVEVFLSQAGPGDTVLFYFSGHGIEHQGQGYLLPSDAESGPLLPQFAVSLDFLNRSLASNRASQKIVLLDACYSGVGKAIGAGMGDAFAQSLFTEGRVTLASCSEGEQSFEWPDRSASVFTHYVCEGLGGEADYDSDQSVCLTELNRYVTEQVRRWAADHNKQQNPRMLANVSGEIALARIPQEAGQLAPSVSALELGTATVRFNVSSSPAGAQVSLDGKPSGVTPCVVEVDLGPGRGKKWAALVVELGQHRRHNASLPLRPDMAGKTFPYQARLDDEAMCERHLRLLVVAAQMYAAANDDLLPDPARWAYQLRAYIPPGEDDCLHCLADASPGLSYAMNANLAGIRRRDMVHPERTVVFFESTLRTGSASDANTCWPYPTRHVEGNLVTFVDGVVRAVRLRPSFEVATR